MPPGPPTPAPAFHADRAVRTAAEDRLDIAPFVQRLLGPLLHAPADGSLVVGLYGRWGHGKTSALQLLEEALGATTRLEGEAARRTPYAQVVRFTPWLYSSVETLLPAFFDTLAAGVGGLTVAPEKKREKLRGALQGMGEFAAPAAKLGGRLVAGKPGEELAGLVADAVRGTARGGAELVAAGGKDRDEARFRRLRDKAAGVLRDFAARGRPIRVVVTIDDLDRAAGVDEVLAVLKLVKLAADLPNVSYVIAMDREHVEHLLGEAVSERFGREFLDKIVQVGVTLPPLDPKRLSRLLVEEARAVADAAGMTTAAALDVPWDQPLYETWPQDGFETRLRPAPRSLRDVARILNAYRFAALTGEPAPPLHAADLLLLCTLQVVAPSVYDAVRTNGRFLLHEDRSPADTFGRSQRSAAEARRVREARLLAIADGVSAGPPAAGGPDGGGAPGPGAADPPPAARRGLTGHTARDLLQYLFPYALAPRSEQGMDTWRGARADRDAYRIHVAERFAAYFSLTPPPGEAPARLVSEVFDVLTGRGTDGDGGETTGPAEAAGAPGGPPAWVRLLDARVGALPEDTRESLHVQIGDRLAGTTAARARAMAARLPTVARHSVAIPARRLTGWADDLVMALRVALDDDGPAPPADDRAAALALVRAMVEALGPREAGGYADRVTDSRPLAWLFEDPAERRAVAASGLDRVRALFAATPDVFAASGSSDGVRAVWNYRRLAERAGDASPGEPYAPLQAYLQTVVDREPARVADVVACAGGWSDKGVSLSTQHRDFAETRASLAALVPLAWLEPRVRAAASAAAASAAADGPPDPAMHWPDLAPEYVRALDELETPGGGEAAAE